MDWTYPPRGIDEIAERLVRTVDDPKLTGTRFTYDPHEMLRATREIEDTLTGGGRLWVGFQNAPKLEHEVPRYARITASGAHVVAFGTGTPELPESVRLRWVQVEPSIQRLENQWFLVTTEPEPIAFVSWETSGPDRFGQGGISAPQKTFVGFVSDDRRVVDELVTYLQQVASERTAR